MKKLLLLIFLLACTTLQALHITDKYTVKSTFKGDYKFDSERSSILWELGDHSLSFSYPNMTLIMGGTRWSIYLDGINVKGYYYYKRNVDVELTVIYDAELDKITVYADGYLVGVKSVKLGAINKDLTVKTFTGASYDKFSGTIITELTATAEYIVTLPEPAKEYYAYDYPKNYKAGSQDYSNVTSAIDQLKAFRTPIITNAPRTASCINLMYMGGNIPNAVEMQKLLHDKYGWEIRVIDNLNSFYAERNKPTEQSLSLSLIEYAKTVPNAFISVASSWAHMSEINGIQMCNLDSLTTASPNSALDGDKEIYRIQAEAVKDKIGTMQVARHHENDEYITGYANKLGFEKTAGFVNHVLSGFRDVLNPASSIEYDVHDPWFYSNTVFGFKERMAINTNHKGTIQFYPRYQWNWRGWSGADRGLEFYMNSKAKEIEKGFPLNTPYICFGWDKIEENNIRPGAALGLAKILKVAGSAYFYSSYFTINSSGVQEKKGYVWQSVVPAYVEEAVNDYQNIITEGELLKGDVLYNYYYNGTPVYQYNFKTGDKSIFCVVRQLGDDYLIASTYQPLNNYKGQSNTKEFSITLNGDVVTMSARKQGSVYLYNKGKGKLKMLDREHQAHHFERWD